MAASKDYIPQNDLKFDRWFKNLYQYVAAKIDGPNPEWTHIPEEAIKELSDAYLDWFTNYTPTLKPHTHGETVAKDEAKARAKKVIRPFVMQWLYFKQVTNTDRVNIELHIHDETRTHHDEVLEIVEFYLEVEGTRKTHVHFKVLGAEGRAKPDGYHGALIVWDVLDEPPEQPEDLKQHVMASRTPHTIFFNEKQRGKTVYVSAAWENGKSIKGQYSEVQWTIVP